MERLGDISSALGGLFGGSSSAGEWDSFEAEGRSEAPGSRGQTRGGANATGRGGRGVGRDAGRGGRGGGVGVGPGVGSGLGIRGGGAGARGGGTGGIRGGMGPGIGIGRGQEPVGRGQEPNALGRGPNLPGRVTGLAAGGEMEMMGGAAQWERDKAAIVQRRENISRGPIGQRSPANSGTSSFQRSPQQASMPQAAGRQGAQKTLKTLLAVEGPLRNQHTARRFISDLENEKDDVKLLQLLGQGKGLERLTEICNWPHLSIDAGKSATLMSFQRVVVPLLRLITSTRVTFSPLTYFVNNVYQRVHGACGFSHKLVECLQKLQVCPFVDLCFPLPLLSIMLVTFHLHLGL